MYRIVAIQPFGCNTTINFISFHFISRPQQLWYVESTYLHTLSHRT